MQEAYDTMTTQELEAILRDEDADTEAVLSVLEILSERQQTSEEDAAQNAWDTFRREYLPCKETLVLREKKDRRTLKRALQAAVACVVLLVATFHVLFTTVEAFRIAVTNVVIENAQGHWSISGSILMPEEESSIVHRFNIDDPLGGLIAKEYVLKEISNADPKRITVHYENAAGDDVRFLCLPLNSSVQMDSERAEVSKKVQVLEHDGVLVVKNGDAQIAWWDDEVELIYWLSADNTTEKEMYTLAERLAKIIDGEE